MVVDPACNRMPRSSVEVGWFLLILAPACFPGQLGAELWLVTGQKRDSEGVRALWGGSLGRGGRGWLRRVLGVGGLGR